MSTTRLLCTIALITASLYDLVAVQIGGVDVSISRWFQTVGYAAPFQIFVLGYLAGHFFGFMPFKYRLFVINGRFVVSGTRPSPAKATRVLRLTETPNIEEVDVTVC